MIVILYGDVTACLDESSAHLEVSLLGSVEKWSLFGYLINSIDIDSSDHLIQNVKSVFACDVVDGSLPIHINFIDIDIQTV